MTIDRISTAQQSAYYLSQINKAGAALDKTNQQIASGVVSSTYAGFGTSAQVLQATISANARNTAYQTATTLATTQADTQDTQLTQLSSLASQLQTAVSNAVANNDPTTLMSQAQSIFDQAVSILNSKDSNGNYIYGGGNTASAPVTVDSLADLASLSDVSDAFANGDVKQSVQVSDGQTVTYGLTASDVASGLMQSLKDIAGFDAGPDGDFDDTTTGLTDAQNSFLSGQITTLTKVNSDLNTVTAQNGYAYDALQNAASQQSSMATLYSGFISQVQDTNMADAASQLSLNQTALQAALEVTSSLGQLSLLNYLPAGS